MYDFDSQQVIEPKRQFTGVWIPSEVMLDERLSAVDKILYAEIASFGDKGCWKRSEELQQICGVKRDGLQAACKRLRGCGYISESKTISGRMVRRATIGFNPQPSNPVQPQPSNPVQHIDNTIEYTKDTNSEVSKKLLDLLNEKTKRNFRMLPRGWKETLKRFSLEEIAEALDVLVNDDWHSKKIHELKSDYLLRASTIDNMLSRGKKQDGGAATPDGMADLDELYGDGKWMETL